MNNQFTQATLLFQTAEQKMLGYAEKIEHLQKLIKQHLEKDSPLPEGARITLRSPDDKAFLADALVQWNKGKKASLNIASGLCAYLGEYDIGMAKYTITNWGNGISRPMERILSDTYEESDILPPPHLHLAEVRAGLRELFPANKSEALNSPQEEAFIHHLKATVNPWEKYVKK